MRYRDRRHAGRELARHVADLGLRSPVVLALSPGGVPVAAEVATGATVRAAVGSLRRAGAARVVVAAPVGPPDVERILDADLVVCPARPRDFAAVGVAYDDVTQTGDDEVRAALASASRRRGPATGV